MNQNAIVPQPNQESLTAPINTIMAAMQLDMLRLKQRRAAERTAHTPVSRTTLELAREMDTALQSLTAKVRNSDLAAHVSNAYKLHRFLSGLLSGFTSKLAEERTYCSRVMLDWQREERERVAAERRRQEAEQIAVLEAQAIADAELLEAQGDHAEAERRLDAPIVATVDVAPEKIAGVAITERWMANEVTDPVALVKYLAEHPHHCAGINWSAALRKSYWRDVLNHRSGDVAPCIPGLDVIKQGTTVNRNNSIDRS